MSIAVDGFVDTELGNSSCIETVVAVDGHMSLSLERMTLTSQLIDVYCKLMSVNLVQYGSSCTMAFEKCNLCGSYELVHVGSCSLIEEPAL